MIPRPMNWFCALVALAVLGACSTMKEPEPQDPQMVCDNSVAPGVEVAGMGAWPQMMKQVAVGKLTRKALRRSDDLEEVLAGLEKKIADSYDTEIDQKAALAARLDKIEESPIAEGLAGISVRTLLHSARQTLDASGNFSQPATVITRGKIIGYHYDKGPSEDKNDCLQVLMETWPVIGGATAPLHAYRWTVFGNFHHTPKTPKEISGQPNPNYDPNDVFSGSNTVPIPEDMASSRGGFNYKLWARGSDIEVRKVELKQGTGPFVTLPPTHPLYKTTAASCLDMMFKSVPPRTLPPNARPPFYCLGRCEHPPIINTM